MNSTTAVYFARKSVRFSVRQTSLIYLFCDNRRDYQVSISTVLHQNVPVTMRSRLKNLRLPSKLTYEHKVIKFLSQVNYLKYYGSNNMNFFFSTRYGMTVEAKNGL